MCTERGRSLVSQCVVCLQSDTWVLLLVTEDIYLHNVTADIILCHFTHSHVGDVAHNITDLIVQTCINTSIKHQSWVESDPLEFDDSRTSSIHFPMVFLALSFLSLSRILFSSLSVEAGYWFCIILFLMAIKKSKCMYSFSLAKSVGWLGELMCPFWHFVVF